MVRVGAGQGGGIIFGAAVTSELAAATISHMTQTGGAAEAGLPAATLQDLVAKESDAAAVAPQVEAGVVGAAGFPARHDAQGPSMLAAGRKEVSSHRPTVIDGMPYKDVGRSGKYGRVRHVQSGTEMLVFRRDHRPVVDQAFIAVRLVGPGDEFLVGSTRRGMSIFSTETRALLMEGPFDDVAVETLNRAVFAVNVKEPDGTRRLFAGDEAPRLLLRVHSPGSGYVFRTADGRHATLVPVSPVMPEPPRATLPFPPQATPASAAPVIPPTAKVVPPTRRSLSAYEEAMARLIGGRGMPREKPRQPEFVGKTGEWYLRWMSMGALLCRAPSGFPVIREVFPRGLILFGPHDEYAYGAALRGRTGVFSTELGDILLESSFDHDPTMEELERLIAEAKDLILR